MRNNRKTSNLVILESYFSFFRLNKYSEVPEIFALFCLVYKLKLESSNQSFLFECLFDCTFLSCTDVFDELVKSGKEIEAI